ncbi:MAG: hypothetical protein CME26_06550 [Gemmatimonadetes bacterium]|nr:hypothetical protein [Gemmatimonadota bacterium]
MSREKPNILFLFTDDQRFDTIRALGNEDLITPNLDRLVEEGTTFTQASIMGGTSGAVCMPSRAMLMTGRTLFHLEGEGQSIPETHAMLPEMLQGEGYKTFGTGKWHNGRSAFARGFDYGDRIFFGGMSDHFKVPLNPFDDTGNYPEDRIYHEVKSHSSDLFSGAVIDFIRSYDEPNPFFAYVSFTAPHDPRDTHPEFHAMYDPEKVELPPNCYDVHPFDNGELEIRDEMLAPFPRTSEVVREHLAAYYAMISHIDRQVGEILRALEETGQIDRTLIVFAGDNGLAVGQHGLMGKQNLYEHSVRVPLVFKGPGIPRNERRSAYCYLIDIFPTLLELIDAAIPESVEGLSLVGSMRDGSESVREGLLYAYKGLHRSAKQGEHKLIEYSVDGVRTTQLFNLASDPWEMKNLAEAPGHEDRISRLRGEMERWRTELDDSTDFWS